jgi:hypothetical protein
VTDATITIFLLVIAVLLFVLGFGGILFAYKRRDCEALTKELTIARRENTALLDELGKVKTENEEFRQQNKRLYKVTLPSFGEPKLKRYNPLEYEVPLVCPTCKKTLVAKENFYEIPVTNEPGTVVAVHLRCEREVKLG